MFNAWCRFAAPALEAWGILDGVCLLDGTSSGRTTLLSRAPRARVPALVLLWVPAQPRRLESRPAASRRSARDSGSPVTPNAAMGWHGSWRGGWGRRGRGSCSPRAEAAAEASTGAEALCVDALAAPGAVMSAGEGQLEASGEDLCGAWTGLRAAPGAVPKAGGKSRGPAVPLVAQTLAEAQTSQPMVLMQTPPLLSLSAGGGPSDRQVLEGLAASDRVHQRLLRAASRAQLLLCGRSGGNPGSRSPAACVELYGSLALSSSAALGSAPDTGPSTGACTGNGASAGAVALGDHGFSSSAGSCSRGLSWQRPVQRGATYQHYARPGSDADLVVLLRAGVAAHDVVNRLLDRGHLELVAMTAVPKFATTHFTLRGPLRSGGGSRQDLRGFVEAPLDLTCIDCPRHFERFRCRQEAFRQVFREVRGSLQAQFGLRGTLAFDAYVYLLKAFAAKVPGGALSGFQALCLGLFVIQLRLYELCGLCPPTGMALLECFLRFCCVFFSDTHTADWKRLRSYRCCAIDISLGGRLLPRMAAKWRCEVYNLGAEVHLQAGLHERMNIAHSIIPEAICNAARETLSKTCRVVSGECVWT